MKPHFPLYEIIYRKIQVMGGTHSNLLSVKRLNKNDIPIAYKFFYATPHTNGWKKIPIKYTENERLKAKVGEIERGWHPSNIIENKEEKRRFQFSLCDVDIIFRFEYKSQYGWHCSVCRFILDEMNNMKWLEKELDYYSCRKEKKMKKIRNKYKDVYGKIIKKWIDNNKKLNNGEKNV